MPLEQINKAIKQLEFLKNLPHQDKVIDTIRDSLENDFVIIVYAEPYITEIRIIRSWDGNRFYETYKYKQGTSSNHKSIALMNALIKARNYYDSKALPT